MKINNTNSTFIYFAVILFVFFFSSHSAHALTISPARIEVSGDPGTTVTKEITLFNDSKTGEETYYVTYSNFEAQGETGSPLFVEPKSGLGTWMNAGESITLKSNESKKITLTINIPSDAYSGGHFAVVFFGNNPADGGGQVSVGAKTGTLILLTVTGDVLEAGGLSSFNTQNNKFFYNSLPVNLEYRWKNDGNDRVKPEGKVTIRNMFYIPVARINANSVSGNILPHSTRLFNIEWIKHKAGKNEIIPTSFMGSYFNRVSYQWKNFAVGLYFANLNLVYGSQNNHSSKMAFFFVFPWQLLIIIFIVLIIVFFTGRKLLKIYNKRIIERARLGMNIPNDANHV
jgi:hypothetical protein